MEIIWRVLSWEGEGRKEGKGTGIVKYKVGKNRQWVVKNSVGSGEAKELLCMTHGHELREGGDYWREWWYQVGGVKGGKTVIA